MNDEAKKMRFEKIISFFVNMKSGSGNKETSLNGIGKELGDIFDGTFNVSLVSTKPSEPSCVMSVYPNQTTMDKIVASIVNEEGTAVIKSLWEQNKTWNIEIDKKILNDRYVRLTAAELTALLMHEVGHTIDANSMATRISRVVKFEFAKLSMPLKKVFQNKKFSALLTLPIFDICNFSPKANSGDVKEASADAFAMKMGFKDDLASALTKLINANSSGKDLSAKQVMNFSVETINQLKGREAKASKNRLNKLKDSAGDGIVAKHISEIQKNIFESTEFMTESVHMEKTCDTVESIMDNYYTEFFIFGPKKLERLDTYILDYIQVEMAKMKTQDDKLLLVSYIHGKLDIVQYYIDILSNPKTAKKFAVPHSMEYLIQYRDRLNKLRMDVLKYPIEERKYGITIQYPAGYEG